MAQWSPSAVSTVVLQPASLFPWGQLFAGLPKSTPQGPFSPYRQLMALASIFLWWLFVAWRWAVGQRRRRAAFLRF